jgi:hypothetical protein
MALRLRDRLAALRQRLRPALPGPVDAVVTHCEVNDRHGTGVLLQRLFGAGSRIVSIRSRDMYRGEQRFGARRLRLAHRGATDAEVAARVALHARGLDVRRILCAPYYPDDVRTALALARVTGAPIATWIMDDQNIHVPSIADALLRELLERSALRLAISTELRAAYQAKFRRLFWLAPPVVPAAHLLKVPAAPDEARLAARRGMLLGNIWGPGWLEGLLAAVAGSGVVLDWHRMGGTPWRRDDEARLAGAGVGVRPFLEEGALVAELRACPFVVVPSGDLAAGDTHESLAMLSLPSRIPFAAATAGTPTLVLGHPATAAARFVARHGLGLVAPYQQRAFVEAVEAICRPEAQARCRSAAARLAPSLSAEGMADWIWRSLEAGRAVDGRFQALEGGA